MQQIKDFIRQAGPIRISLYVLAFFTVLLKPENNSTVNLEGLAFIPTLVLPVIAPLLTTGFLLDMLMCKIYSSEQTDDIKARFKKISRVNLAFVVVLLATWVPYLLSMG